MNSSKIRGVPKIFLGFFLFPFLNWGKKNFDEMTAFLLLNLFCNFILGLCIVYNWVWFRRLYRMGDRFILFWVWEGPCQFGLGFEPNVKRFEEFLGNFFCILNLAMSDPSWRNLGATLKNLICAGGIRCTDTIRFALQLAL